MSEHNKTIQEFLQTACNQIRYKSVHTSIVNELTDHIEEQKSQYIKEGFSEEAATNKAIEQMGDPVLVGKELNKAHRPKIEWSILSLVAVLVLIGGAVQFLISGTNTNHTGGFLHFLTYLPVGLAAFFFTYFFDYTLIGRYPKIAYFILLATAVAESQLSGRVCGCYPHIYYFALLFIPIFAGIVYSFRNKGYLGIIACGLFYFGAAFLCIIAQNLSAFVLLTFSCLIILTHAIVKGYFGGNKKIGLAVVYIPTFMTFVLSVLCLIFLLPYRMRRIALSLIPELDPQGAGYNSLMVKRIIKGSQPFGEALLGPGYVNMPVNQILPCWDTDFSLTYIIGHLGLVAGLVIIGIISVLIVRISISIIKQKNVFGYLLSYSACIAIAGQFVLYVLLNFGLLTLFSVTLPFISYGGMGFIVNMILAGLVLSVYRRTNIVVDNMQISTPKWRLFTFQDGKIIIDLGLNSSKKPLS